MHGYKWPIHCTRTRTVTVEELTEEEATAQAQAAEERQCRQAFEQAERVADGGLALWGHPNENYNGIWFWKRNQVLHGWPFYQVLIFYLKPCIMRAFLILKNRLQTARARDWLHVSASSGGVMAALQQGHAPRYGRHRLYSFR